MARHSTPLPPWVSTILESFSPGELQAGAFIGKPRKLRDGTITQISERSPGTRIPASTWSRMQAGLIRPGPKTIAKLAKFKERYQYNQLRASGVSIKEAKKYSRSDFTEAMKIAAQSSETSKRIAAGLSEIQGREVDYTWILYHMMHSENEVEDWEEYASEIY